MGNRFEDEVIEFVAKHRPLKLLALAIAVVGVVSSTLTTLSPALAKVQPTIYRVLNIDLEDSDRTRYGCAYFTGRTIGELVEADQHAASAGARQNTIRQYKHNLFFCQAVLGQSGSRLPIASDSSDKELDLTRDLLLDDLQTLAGNLAKERLTFLLNEIGRETVMLQASMSQEGATHERHVADEPLTELEKSRATRVTRAVAEARWLCACRLPDETLDASSRLKLGSSLAAFDRAWERQFPKPG